jgi:hypothetical protein
LMDPATWPHKFIVGTHIDNGSQFLLIFLLLPFYYF